MGIIFDLDQTLIDSSIAAQHRKNRDWKAVYDLIPEMRLYEGVSELLSALNSASIKVVIVTSSPRKYCELVLSYFNIKYVALICYHDTNRHKPHPEPIEKAIGILGESLDNIYSIGDDENDMIASKEAGVTSCLALWGREHMEVSNYADYSFESIESFREFLKI